MSISNWSKNAQLPKGEKEQSEDNNEIVQNVHLNANIDRQVILKMPDNAGDAKNIEFTNWTGRNKLVSLINNCLATIYIPKDEDFGISPIESMAAGKPVIGVSEGGLKETIIDKQSGFLLNPDLPLSKQLMELISTLDETKLSELKGAAIRQAEQFTEEVFIEQIRSCLN